MRDSIELQRSNDGALFGRSPFARSEHGAGKELLHFQPCRDILRARLGPLSVNERGDGQGTPFQWINRANRSSLRDANDPDERECHRPCKMPTFNLQEEEDQGPPGEARPGPNFKAGPSIQSWGSVGRSMQDGIAEEGRMKCPKW